MGGRAGHMSHLYDDPMLTFGKLKQIFKAASAGKLKGTEKTDGQNISISYSMNRDEAVAIRNDDHAYKRGFNSDDLGAYMAAANPKFRSLRPRAAGKKQRVRDKRATPAHVINAYMQAMETFETFARRLPPELQIELFGQDANIFYNAEVMSASSRNAINYDVEILLIHRVGHEEYDEENRDTVAMSRDEAEGKAKKLAGYLENFYDIVEENIMSLQVGAIIQLKALATDAFLQEAETRLNKYMNAAGMIDNNNIGQLIVEGLEKIVNQHFPDLEVESRKLLYKRMYAEYYDQPGGDSKKDRGIDNRSIFKSIPDITPELMDLIRGLVSRSKKIIKDILEPLEDIIHDFSVEVLRSLESAFILGKEGDISKANREEVVVLQQRITRIIDTIEASDSPAAKEFLRQQMKKLKDVQKIVTAAEGFVFDFDGHTYKFTGNFAPMNQLLGLEKFQRADIPADLFANIGSLNEAFVNKGSSFMFIPGGFKPPHKGHLYLLKTAINKLPDAKPFLVTGETARDGVTLRQAMQVWKIYMQNEPDIGLDELSIITVPEGGLVVLDNNGEPVKNKDGKTRITNSPLQAIYNSAISLPEASIIYLVASTADPGHAAIGESIMEARPDLRVQAYEIPTLDDPGTGDKLSATDLRRSIIDSDFETFRKYLPPNEHVLKQAKYIFYNILKAKEIEQEEETEQEEKETQPLAENFRAIDIYRIIEELIDELSSGAGGSVQGPAGTFTGLDVEKENEKQKKHRRPKGKKEKLVGEIVNYLLCTEAQL